jgi:hypothetical protein
MSNIRSEPLGAAGHRLSYNRLAGAAAWLIGAYLTYLFLRTFKGDPLGMIGAGGVALIAQGLLTLAERPLWRWLLRRKGGKFVLASLGVTLIDGLLNAAGLYPYIGALGGSNVVSMVTDVAQLDPTIGKSASAIIAFALGLLIAALAEFYWELD